MQVFYVSGKISGLADLNKPKFNSASELIRSIWKNATVINPHELPQDHDLSWASYMKQCIRSLTRCDAVFVLDDWSKSDGAIIEVAIAKILGIPVNDLESMEALDVSKLRMAYLLFKAFLNRC
jgi:hypothetical protein